MIRMFAVQDIVAGAFHAPFLASTEGVATRMMSDCVRRPDHPYAAHPADYVLFEVGGFDEITAELIQDGAVRRVMSLSQLVQSSDQ